MSQSEEIVVSLSNSREKNSNIVKVIWLQLTSGIGIWGSFKPLIVVLLALIPFAFLGQHFNREHQKAFDWTLLQIPLSFTIIFWIGLYAWSVVDAWGVATQSVKDAHNLRVSDN
ncbi:MAG: hypothetical protein QGH90_07925 [Candidatus Poseidoniaceae archaeon]|nr:hypothetical protein [Candidatus Poseidoniaceae archaeon]